MIIISILVVGRVELTTSHLPFQIVLSNFGYGSAMVETSNGFPSCRHKKLVANLIFRGGP